MGASHELGRRGEALAERELCRTGWRILDRNFRFGRREIDLIAAKNDVVAFVEVKARAGAGFGHPLEAVTWRKRREIEAVARYWIARRGRSGQNYRFDAMAVCWPPGQASPTIEHIEGAWTL